MTMPDLVFLALYVLTVAFLTRILLGDYAWAYPDEENFPKRAIIIWGFAYPIDNMHRIKKLLGLYRVDEFGHWIPRSTVLWSCGYCLSFWVNLIGLGILLLTDQLEARILLSMVFSVPFAVGYMYEWLDK